MSLDYRSVEPPQELKSYVKDFWILQYNERTPRIDYFLPNGMAYLFFMNTEEDFETYYTSTDTSYTTTSAVYFTYLNTLAELKHKKINARGVAIHPIYINSLFEGGCPRFLNKLVRIEDPELIQMLNPCLPAEDLFQKISSFLVKRLRKHQVPESLINVYFQIIRSKQYRMSVQEVSDFMGYSTRHLNALFHQYLGISPKRLLQITRFNHAQLLLMQQGGLNNLSQIAQELGYHDQAHFIKEVKSLCGKRPGDLTGDFESLSKIFTLY